MLALVRSDAPHDAHRKHLEKLDFEDMELLQLEFYVSEMEKNCSMGGEIRRHESIYNKIKKEQSRRILVKLEEEALGKFK